MQSMEQGMKLALEISKLEEKVVNHLKENPGEMSNVLILTAFSSFAENIRKEMMSYAKSRIEKHPEIIDEIRKEEDVPAEAVDKFMEALNKEDAAAEPSADDVDFKPIQ